MPRIYNPAAWYWRVGGQSPPIYDSAARAYVAESDAGYVAFLADVDGATGEPLVETLIASEARIREVLAAAGVQYLSEPLPPIVEERPRATRFEARVQIGAHALAHATPTPLAWGSAVLDPAQMWSPADATRVTLARSGIWFVTLAAEFAESSAGPGGTPNAGLRGAQVRIGSSAIVTDRRAPAPADDTAFAVSEFFAAAQGDAVRVFAEQRCGGAMNLAARLTLRWVR